MLFALGLCLLIRYFPLSFSFRLSCYGCWGSCVTCRMSFRGSKILRRGMSARNASVARVAMGYTQKHNVGQDRRDYGCNRSETIEPLFLRMQES